MYLQIALRCTKCTVNFIKASKLYIDCQCHKHAGDHLAPFARGALFGSKQGKEPQARKLSLCSWNVSPFCFYNQAQATTQKHQGENMPMNHPIIRKERTLGNHKPDIEFIVQLLVHSRSYSAAMTLLGVIHQNAHAIW